MLNAQTIGRKISEARKRMHLSQARLAGHLFISPQAVGKWERGESMPDIIALNRLAEILGVDLNYFSEGFQSDATEMTPSEPVVKPPADLPSGKHKNKPGWDMSRGNWVDGDFSGLNNLHEKFSASNMQRCKFIGSDLQGLLLTGNHMDGCDFSGSDLRSSHIRSSHITGNQFRNCALQEAEFSASHIKGCDFSGANFTGAGLKNGAFVKNTIADAVWNRTSFIGMQIDGIVFDGAIDDCYFENCSFRRVTFRNAALKNTFFKNKSLKGIRFIDCQADRMTYEFLKNGKADLTGITR